MAKACWRLFGAVSFACPSALSCEGWNALFDHQRRVLHTSAMRLTPSVSPSCAHRSSRHRIVDREDRCSWPEPARETPILDVRLLVLKGAAIRDHTDDSCFARSVCRLWCRSRSARYRSRSESRSVEALNWLSGDAEAWRDRGGVGTWAMMQTHSHSQSVNLSICQSSPSSIQSSMQSVPTSGFKDVL